MWSYVVPSCEQIFAKQITIKIQRKKVFKMKYDNLSKDELHTYLSKFHSKYVVPMPETKEDRKRIVDWIGKELTRVAELFCTIQTSVNEKEFALSLGDLTTTLYNLTSYENTFDFPELPSKTMQKVWENKVKYMDQLYERIESEQKKTLTLWTDTNLKRIVRNY